jgi:hypothetical protein
MMRQPIVLTSRAEEVALLDHPQITRASWRTALTRLRQLS